MKLKMPMRHGHRGKSHKKKKRGPAAEKRALIAVEEPNNLAEAQRMLEDIRLKNMLEACTYDALDPAVLDGEITLPADAIEAIQKEDFDEDDLHQVLTSISRDNIGQLVALLKSKDPEIQIEAWSILLKAGVGERKKIEHTGPGQGGAIILQLMAPDGQVKKLGEDEEDDE